MTFQVLISLDRETKKVYDTIPRGTRSETIRNFLLSLQNTEPPDPKQRLANSFSTPSDSGRPEEKHSKTPDEYLSEMAATVNNGTRTSKRRPEDNIRRRLREASPRPRR